MSVPYQYQKFKNIFQHYFWTIYKSWIAKRQNFPNKVTTAYRPINQISKEKREILYDSLQRTKYALLHVVVVSFNATVERLQLELLISLDWISDKDNRLLGCVSTSSILSSLA